MTMDNNDSITSAIEDVPQSLDVTVEQTRNLIKHYKQELVTLRATMRAAESNQDTGQFPQGKQQ